MTDWATISADLAKPLDSRHVQPPMQYGPKGSYIEAWHAQAEANRIFGFGGWCQEIVSLQCVCEDPREIGRNKDAGWGVTYTATVRITVDGVQKTDFGAGHGYDRDKGLAHESAGKEAVSDAMKRALKAFGNPFGLALYDKTKANVADLGAEEAHAERVLADCAKLEASTMKTNRAVWVAIYKAWDGNVPPEIVLTKDTMKAKFERDTA